MAVVARLVSRYRFALLNLAALVILALTPWLNPSLATGLFDLHPRDILYATCLAVLVAWSCAITMRLIELYAPLRLDRAVTPAISPLTWPSLLIALLPAAFVIAQIVFISHTESAVPLLSALSSAAAGVGMALIFVYAALLIYALLVPPAFAKTFPDVVIPSGSILPWVTRVAALTLPWPFRTCSDTLGRFFARRPGYTDRHGCLFPGHLLALTFTLTLLLFSAIFGWGILWRADPKYPSAIFSILFLLLFLVWFFSGLAFFFDYWRVPILSCLIFVGLSLWLIPVPPAWRPHDYEFAAWPNNPRTRPLYPEDIVRDSRRVIIVAAEGGGIQAAAWTAEILTRLSAIKDFDSSVKAISAVSGGSVGAMHYLTRANPNPLPASLRARVSLLNAVGWAMIFRDSRRLRYPLFDRLLNRIEKSLWPTTNMPDRGVALERQLARFLTKQDTFDNWRERARAGRMPAVFFNTTLVSTGEPAPFANIDLPSAVTVKTFQNRFAHDAAVASAVRLSAAFPMVSPAASPSAPTLNDLELVDGGYFDNTGVHSALAFLSAALPALERNKARVLIIRIKSFPPDPRSREPYRPGWWQTPVWLDQFAAPFSTMISTRTTGQDNSTARALELTALAYSSVIDFSWIDARFPRLPGVAPEKVPLNWHLTKTQENWIADAWTQVGSGIELQVRSFLEQ